MLPVFSDGLFPFSCCKICNNCLGFNLCNYFVNFAPQPFDFGDGFADFGVKFFDVDDFAAVFGLNIVAASEVVVFVFDGLLGSVLVDLRHIGFVREQLDEFGNVFFG